MIQNIKKVVVAGAGTMGHGIAQAFAQAGYNATMVARTQKTLDRAVALIESSLKTMADERILDESSVKSTMERITATNSLEEAAHDADIAFETITEDKDMKKAIFAQLDALCPPRTLLASNTTFLNIFDFVETARPDKVMIAHWYTPPQLIPLVDVVKGPQTDQASIDLMCQVLKDMGKKPVVFNKPISGYVVSRFQGALAPEIHFLLDNDYLTPEELDEAARWGLAFRMMVVGVVQRYDFGGLDLTVKIRKNASLKLTPQDYQPKKLMELVEQGAYGVKSGKGFYDYGGRSEAEICRERDIKLIRIFKELQNIGL